MRRISNKIFFLFLAVILFIFVAASIYFEIKMSIELWQSDLPFWLKMKLWKG